MALKLSKLCLWWDFVTGRRQFALPSRTQIRCTPSVIMVTLLKESRHRAMRAGVPPPLPNPQTFCTLRRSTSDFNFDCGNCRFVKSIFNRLHHLPSMNSMYVIPPDFLIDKYVINDFSFRNLWGNGNLKARRSIPPVECDSRALWSAEKNLRSSLTRVKASRNVWRLSGTVWQKARSWRW